MQDIYNDLEELCGTVSREIGKANKEIGDSGALSAGDIEYLDKLTHMMKSIKTTMAMIDSEEGYSGGYPMNYSVENSNGGSYARGYSRNGSYARGRGSSARSNRGYSRDSGDMVEELRELMNDAPDERTRQEFQRFISKIENM